jgi:hypothetical protein
MLSRSSGPTSTEGYFTGETESRSGSRACIRREKAGGSFVVGFFSFERERVLGAEFAPYARSLYCYVELTKLPVFSHASAEDYYGQSGNPLIHIAKKY